MRPLTSLPKYDVADTVALLATKTRESLVAKPSWDIRLLRDEATHFLHRCSAELLARRELHDMNEADVLEAVKVRVTSGEAEPRTLRSLYTHQFRIAETDREGQ